jgi:hypothetical protein
MYAVAAQRTQHISLQPPDASIQDEENIASLVKAISFKRG